MSILLTFACRTVTLRSEEITPLLFRSRQLMFWAYRGGTVRFGTEPMPDEGRAIIFVFGILIFFIALSVYFGDSCAAACGAHQIPHTVSSVSPRRDPWRNIAFDSMTPAIDPPPQWNERSNH